jgi:hypothetical protein
MRYQTGPDHPIESWTDEELLDQYRYIRAELAEDRQVNKDSENNPAEVLADEIRRRRLPLPTHSSAASPGREDEDAGHTE